MCILEETEDNKLKYAILTHLLIFSDSNWVLRLVPHCRAYTVLFDNSMILNVFNLHMLQNKFPGNSVNWHSFSDGEPYYLANKNRSCTE